MWEAIKSYCRQGYKTFCFGKTEPENNGLRQFKNGWGASEKIIKNCKYDIKKSLFIRERNTVSGFHNKIFSLMPSPLLKITGSLLYKHIG